MDSDNLTYLVFFGSLVIGIALGFLLPDVLHVTQETAEEWVMVGLLPVMVWVSWRLRGDRPQAPTAEPQPQHAHESRKS